MRDAIRELSKCVEDKLYIKRQLKEIHIGEDNYSIYVEHIGNEKLRYSVIKNNYSNLVEKRVTIERVDNLSLLYSDKMPKLPERVARYIRIFDAYYTKYRLTGEKALEYL